MPIENTLIAKVGGGLVAVGGATGAGIVYRADISKWFSPTTDTATYFFVASQTGTKDSTNDLYKDVEGKKVKNYKCKLESTTYECDIVKKIDKTPAATKKWLNLNTNFSAEKNDDTLTKSSFETANELFVLKINTTDEIKFDDSKLFDVIDNDDNAKKFGQLKPIFGKKNNELLGKVNLFLGQIKDFENDSTTTLTFPVTSTGKEYKCGFGSEKNNLKECEIHKFTASQSSPTDYSNLNFTGKKTDQLTTNTTLNKKDFYLIKFKEDLINSYYSGKDLIYFETTTGTTTESKKIINFSPVLTTFLFNPTPNSETDNKLLIIDKK